MNITVIPMFNLPQAWHLDIPKEWQGEVYRLDTELRLVRDVRRGQVLLIRRCDKDGTVTFGGRTVPGWFVQFAYPAQRQHLGHMLDTIRRGDMWSWGVNRPAALKERMHRQIRRAEGPAEEAMEGFTDFVRNFYTPVMDDSIKQRVGPITKDDPRSVSRRLAAAKAERRKPPLVLVP